MTTFVRAYLRASTADQDSGRAKGQLEEFAVQHGLKVAAWYQENESGTKLQRPELMRLIADASAGDILLVEQVDRLSRLNTEDWDALKQQLTAKRIKVVALDLPTSYMAVQPGINETTQAIIEAMNRMMLDMLAAVARKDYNDRRHRQQQGITKAKEAGLYKGRRADTQRHEGIAKMLQSGMSWSDIVKATKASRSTIKRVNDSLKASEAQSRTTESL